MKLQQLGEQLYGIRAKIENSWLIHNYSWVQWMATGGQDKSHESLDLSEINAELENLDRSSESEPTDSLIWENCQAELAYEHIAKETSEHDFLGFGQLPQPP